MSLTEVVAATDHTGRVVHNSRAQAVADATSSPSHRHLAHLAFKSSVATVDEHGVLQRVSFRGLTTVRSSHPGSNNPVPGADASPHDDLPGAKKMRARMRHDPRAQDRTSRMPSSYYVEGSAVLVGNRDGDVAALGAVPGLGHHGHGRHLVVPLRGDGDAESTYGDGGEVDTVQLHFEPLHGDGSLSVVPSLRNHRDVVATASLDELLACHERARVGPNQREAGARRGADEESNGIPLAQCTSELRAACRARPDIRAAVLNTVSDLAPGGLLESAIGSFPKRGLFALVRAAAETGVEGQAAVAALLDHVLTYRASNAFPGHDDHPVQATVQAQVREAVKAAIDAGTTVFPRHRSHKAVTMVLQALVGVQEPTEVLVTALLNGLDTIEARIADDETADPSFSPDTPRVTGATADEDTLDHLLVTAGALAFELPRGSWLRVAMLERLRAAYHTALDRHEAVHRRVAEFTNDAVNDWETLLPLHQRSVMATVGGYATVEGATSAWDAMDMYVTHVCHVGWWCLTMCLYSIQLPPHTVHEQDHRGARTTAHGTRRLDRRRPRPSARDHPRTAWPGVVTV